MPTASASTSYVAEVGVTETPAPATAVWDTSASTGPSGPRLATTAETDTGSVAPTTENVVPVADEDVTARSASTHSSSVGFATQKSCTAPVRSTSTRFTPATWSRTSIEPTSPSNGTTRASLTVLSTTRCSAPLASWSKTQRGSQASIASSWLPSSSRRTSRSSGGSPMCERERSGPTIASSTLALEAPNCRSTTKDFAGSA